MRMPTIIEGVSKLPQCVCGKSAAKDCEHGRCGDCCDGCPRHPSEDCCDICEQLMHECDCEECGEYDCYRKVPYDCEYNCARCGPMCEDCFGEEYVAWNGETYCECCGDGMHHGGNDNSGPKENW